MLSRPVSRTAPAASYRTLLLDPRFISHLFLPFLCISSFYVIPLARACVFLLFALQMLRSLVPFKARQMERQALSPSSGPNDLFLTMGPNGPQIINDEGRWKGEPQLERGSSISKLFLSLNFPMNNQITQLPLLIL